MGGETKRVCEKLWWKFHRLATSENPQQGGYKIFLEKPGSTQIESIIPD